MNDKKSLEPDYVPEIPEFECAYCFRLLDDCGVRICSRCEQMIEDWEKWGERDEN